MSPKKLFIAVSPCIIMFILAVIYANVQMILIEAFNIPSFNERGFDANDLTRSYFSLVSIVSLAAGWIATKKLSLNKPVITLYFSLSGVAIFYIAGLFSSGLMLR